MTFSQKLKLFKIINYKVTKRGNERHRVRVTIEVTRSHYKDPYDSSKGRRTYIEDKTKDMYMTDTQIKVLDNQLSYI